MRRVAVGVIVFGLCALVVPAAAQDSGGDYPEISKLVRSFRDAKVDGDLITAADPGTPLSPFGGDSKLPPSALGPVTLQGTFTVIVNPTDQPVPIDSDANGVPDFPGSGLRPPSYDQGWRSLDPFAPDAFLPPIRLRTGAKDDLTAAARDLVDAVTASLGANDNVMVQGSAGFPQAGPVVLHGGLVSGDLPLGCPGSLFELGRVDAINGMPSWKPADFAPNDIFSGGSQAIVTRCNNGQWTVHRMVNTGKSFKEVPTRTITYVTPHGWLSVTPGSELLNRTGGRTFAFTTPTANPYTPDTTGFTAAPAFPALAPPDASILLDDPASFLDGPPLASQTARLGFQDGSCPPASWDGFFEMFLLPGTDGGLSATMEQLTSGQVASGTVTDGSFGDYSFDLTGTGSGYTEHYQWSGSSGTYTHSKGGVTCTWGVVIDPTLIDLVRRGEALAHPTTTTEATTTTTVAATPPGTVAASGPVGESGGFPWPWLGLGGLVVFGGGYLLTRRPRPATAPAGGPGVVLAPPGGDPCAEARRIWEQAKAACDAASAALEKAEEDLQEATRHRASLEKDRADLCREWPPACWDDADGGWIQPAGDPSGRITGRDLHLRRQAVGHLWRRYQAGEVSAADVEAEWRRMDTPEFRAEMRRRDEAAAARKKSIDGSLATAKAAEETASKAAIEARQARDRACDAADEARRRYEECVGARASSAPSGGTATSSPGPATTPHRPAAPATTAPSQPAAPATTAPATTPTEGPDEPSGPPIVTDVPLVLDLTGLQGAERERAERLNRIFARWRGTGDLAGVAEDLLEFQHWHEETFDEPWFEWSNEARPDGVTATSAHIGSFMQSRVMACYEFVHFCAYIASDQPLRRRMGEDDQGNPVPLDDYSIWWGFDDEIETGGSEMSGPPARGKVVTGSARFGGNNKSGYFHVGISVGGGKVIDLGSGGFREEDTSGIFSAAFPSVWYDDIEVGDYNYQSKNPAPEGAR